MIYYFIHQTPFGAFTLAEKNEQLLCVHIGARPLQNATEKRTVLLNRAAQQLDEYFSGKRYQFDLLLYTQGTPFQQNVWNALKEIPYGQTCTYAQLAARLGNPNAYRAVGMANNKNPWAIVVPCHRVIGADGTLTGYAGGLTLKQTLLDLEKQYAKKLTE